MDIPRLVYLAMRINKDNTDTEVFVYISPHVKNVTIEIHLNGWIFDENPDLEYTINYDNPDVKYQQALTKLIKLVERNLE